jgi:hypothetical protein
VGDCTCPSGLHTGPGLPIAVVKREESQKFENREISYTEDHACFSIKSPNDVFKQIISSWRILE